MGVNGSGCEKESIAGSETRLEVAASEISAVARISVIIISYISLGAILLPSLLDQAQSRIKNDALTPSENIFLCCFLKSIYIKMVASR